MSDEERFWQKVRKSDGCWEWTASRKENYGQVWFKKRLTLAHRVSWQLAYGDIEPGLCVLHKCDNPPCVRPDHLFLGTKADNNEDMRAKGRASGGKMPGEQHPISILKDADVIYMRSIWKRRRHPYIHELAETFGVHYDTVWNVLKRKSWKHLP